MKFNLFTFCVFFLGRAFLVRQKRIIIALFNNCILKFTSTTVKNRQSENFIMHQPNMNTSGWGAPNMLVEWLGVNCG